ncbi:MAG: PhoH family protein [Oscillospiraceae bacterium]|nr:PhoH family protein [Oscillospiraceae bacterium]MBQ9695169.1 PhoH family protein [Oscillospiraceae bacterium]MBR1459847.1 PhoH family protein [Oscillospiraceae bacterium]MBR1897712.1 PhoH family protein [Oscillospiraceae bacterium]
MSEAIVSISHPSQLPEIIGSYDENFTILQREFDVVLFCRGADVHITGEEAQTAKAASALRLLEDLAAKGQHLTEQTVRYVISMVAEGEAESVRDLGGDGICVTTSGKVVRPKTVGQKQYVDAIKKHTITLGVGPAGTGKTYLAVALAVRAFKAHEVQKIILTRPAVEAGERLGFLPGDLQSKVDPYLRPLYDALFDMFGADAFARHMEKSVIEVAPLAYMRGRTLDDAFIILDEAQNTTSEQIKMFLTRLGSNSKMVITGDVTQIDLPEKRKSGLIEAMKVLRHVEGISTIRFTERDVVRHKLVQDIIRAYESYYKEGRKS